MVIYMNKLIIVLVVFLLGASTAVAGVKLVKGVDFAQIGIGADSITISKFNDGLTTCYVSRHGKYGSQAISCVK